MPGVVVVGNGPGLASVVNGAAHAHLDRVPLLVISDRYTDAELDTTGHQILDQRALLAPVVKWSATSTRRPPGSTLEQALATALAAPCGAVHLDMPRTVGAEAAGGGRRTTTPPPALPRARVRAAPLPRTTSPRPSPRAPRPSSSPGLEAARTLAAGALAALAERLGAPVLTTYKAKGVLDEQTSAVGGDRDRRGARGAAARGGGRDPRSGSTPSSC